MANEEMRAHWSGGAGGWVDHRELFDAELAGFADLILATLPAGPGDSVLDVGCGTGDLTRRYASTGARALGVDISPAMIGAASSTATEARFVVADAQTDDLAPQGPFTAAVSRFGVMFFDDPVAAFANVASAMAPGGRLAFVCWRGIDENPMFTLGTSVLQERLGADLPVPAPGAPGPFGLAQPGRAVTVLEAAGWVDVAAEPVDVLCDYAIEGSDGVEERIVMILNTTSGRTMQAQLEPELGPEGWSDLLDDVRAELRRHLVDGRVAFPGAVWLVTAQAPT